LIGSNFLEAAEVKGLLGLLLADGSLVKYSTPAGGYVQLTLTGGIHDSAYLEDKVEEFRQFIPTKARIIPYEGVGNVSTRPNPQGVVTGKGKPTMVLRFRVSTNKLLPVYNLLYPGGERRITKQVIDMLGAAAAAWVWAEGARTPTEGDARFDGTTILARVGTSDDEAMLIAGWIEMLTGASSTLIDDVRWKKPRLLFDPRQSAKAKSALRPYAPPSRLHRFKISDDPPTDQDCAELVPGQGDHEHPREQAEAMA